MFLLVCMMVSASILMAAVSNAGKLRSGQEEQQRYLTLASALRLVCDELTESTYRGEYTYSKKTFEIKETVTNPDNGTTTEVVVDEYSEHTYKQQNAENSFQCRLNPGAGVGVLPLGKDLDTIFAERFNGSRITENPDDTYIYKPLEKPFFSGNYKLTVTADDFGEVSVTIRMRRDGVIHLTAELQKDKDGTPYEQISVMEAELLPEKSLDSVLILEDQDDSSLDMIPERECQTEEVRWKLNWIAKKEAKEAGGA